MSIKTKPNHVKRFQIRVLTTVACMMLIVAVAAAMEVSYPNGDLSSFIQGQIEQALSNQGRITTNSGSGGEISISQSITQSIGAGSVNNCDEPDSGDEVDYHVDLTCACAKLCASTCDLLRGYYGQTVQIRLENCNETIAGKLIEVHCQRFLMLEIIDPDDGKGGKYNSPPVPPTPYLRAVNIDKVVWIDFVL